MVTSLLWLACSGSDLEDCEHMERQTFSPVLMELLESEESTLRRVDLVNGQDEEQCLNKNQSRSPPPCGSLQYALHKSVNTSVGGEVGFLRLELGPGVYRAVEESTRIINSYDIALIGAGVSQTFVVCGRNGSEEVLCDYPNFQVINSTRILISGITFSGCGPITSSLYIGASDFIFVDNCSFE